MDGPKASAKSGQRLEILDSFRCIAILSVAAFHYMVRWTSPLDPQNHLPQAGVFSGIVPLQYGWSGVDLFFLISGFVIFMTLERCRSLVDFIARRVARLWPPVLVCGTLTVIVLSLAGPQDWKPQPLEWISSILLFPPDLLGKALHRTDLSWPDGAYWTLWVEIRFYALLAILYLFWGKRTFPVLVLTTLLAALLARTVGGLPRSALEFVFFPTSLPFFTLGVCGYYLFVGRNSLFVICSTVALAALIIFQASFDYLPNGATPMYCVVANLLVLSLFGLFVTNKLPKGPFILGPLLLIGRASYSFYLLHQMIGMVIILLLVRNGASIFLAVPIAFIVVLGLALAIFRFVETPAKDWVHHHTRPLIEFAERRWPWFNFRHV